MQIHRLSPEEALKALGTSDQGLIDAEAARRLGQFGANELRAAEKIQYLAMLGKQFTHFLAILLWAAAALAFAADRMKPGEGMDLLGWAIIGVIVVNSLFSFVQEYRAERAIIALRRLLPLHVKVLRSGEIRETSASGLVPGDVVILAEGDRQGHSTDRRDLDRDWPRVFRPRHGDREKLLGKLHLCGRNPSGQRAGGAPPDGDPFSGCGRSADGEAEG